MTTFGSFPHDLPTRRSVWDLASGEVKGHVYRVNIVAISPDGKTIVSGSSDNTVW